MQAVRARVTILDISKRVLQGGHRVVKPHCAPLRPARRIDIMRANRP
jgi:hypothetical protein